MKWVLSQKTLFDTRWPTISKNIEDATKRCAFILSLTCVTEALIRISAVTTDPGIWRSFGKRNNVISTTGLNLHRPSFRRANKSVHFRDMVTFPNILPQILLILLFTVRGSLAPRPTHILEEVERKEDMWGNNAKTRKGQRQTWTEPKGQQGRLLLTSRRDRPWWCWRDKHNSTSKSQARPAFIYP